ncbi:MAG TPA: NAD-dependent succinate-semialdehyde dehydrogenase [Candidatus Baltobacteraceae bacterium]|jgi:succinate-semialdehyde dehydrogenase/glutarate-semialdehyde dehydrogenase
MAEIVTLNPATGRELERFPYTSAQAVDAALDRGRAAFAQWRAASFGDRARLLAGVAARLRAQTQDLAQVAVREMGKPIVQARAEIEKCARCCDFFAQNAERFLQDELVESNATTSYVSFRPLGIVLAIMPWNFPYWQVFRAAAPALMAGNAMTLKHASNTTRCALEIERIFVEAGAPDGLFTTLLLTGERATEIVADERIVAVTLTGSEGAGISVASAAGKVLKKCVLELGGSDPFVVLGDADIDAAVGTAVTGRFQNNGQSCIAAKRFIVEESVYDRFLSHFAQASANQLIGDPMDERTQLGPCARDDLRDALRTQITQSVVDGARIVTGGKPIEGDGFFFEATVVGDVVPGMPMFDQETFGPAAAVIRARDDDHAIELANQSPFGLGSNLWTRDLDHARRLAARIESGSVFINGMVASDPRLPFGGVKRSGYGRELSSFGIREFVNVQTVWVGPDKTGTSAKPAE